MEMEHSYITDLIDEIATHNGWRWARVLTQAGEPPFPAWQWAARAAPCGCGAHDAPPPYAQYSYGNKVGYMAAACSSCGNQDGQGWLLSEIITPSTEIEAVNLISETFAADVKRARRENLEEQQRLFNDEVSKMVDDLQSLGTITDETLEEVAGTYGYKYVPDGLEPGVYVDVDMLCLWNNWLGEIVFACRELVYREC